MEDVWVCDGHLAYSSIIWYILLPSGIFHGYLVYFPHFWYALKRKIWQSWFRGFGGVSKKVSSVMASLEDGGKTKKWRKK
jgi:hypothetical protein